MLGRRVARSARKHIDMMHASNECNARNISTIGRQRPCRRRGLQTLLIELLHISVFPVLVAALSQDPRKGYSKLFETRLQEKKWAIECLDLLANFITSESQAVSVGDPCHVEFRMRRGRVLVVSYLVYATTTVKMGAVDVVARTVRMV